MKNIDLRLDDLWSQIVKLTHPFCWFPGCSNHSTDACHIMNRRHHATRWFVLNGLGGCREHHNWEETHKTQAKPLIVAKIGEKEYNKLEQMAHSNCNLTDSDKKDILSFLKKEFDKIKKTSYNAYR